MQRTAPLKKWPELSLLEHPGWLEYRVETAKNRARFPAFGVDVILMFGVAYFWRVIASGSLWGIALAMLLLFYVYSRATQVVWESVIVLPSLGIQLETHRGPARFPLFTARRFIPWSSLEDFLINEGLRGWDVRYYLVAMNRNPQGTLKLDVAFENILPRFPILLEVYRGVQEAMRGESERAQIHSSRLDSTDSEKETNK
ncbi:hypothetical protein C2E23DRAFT_371937 [Lenzites betulinus]|nr:hypothetical protein C2E23DRAFT_371937 [Lenzites betulinus]